MKKKENESLPIYFAAIIFIIAIVIILEYGPMHHFLFLGFNVKLWLLAHSPLIIMGLLFMILIVLGEIYQLIYGQKK